MLLECQDRYQARPENSRVKGIFLKIIKRSGLGSKENYLFLVKEN